MQLWTLQWHSAYVQSITRSFPHRSALFNRNVWASNQVTCQDEQKQSTTFSSDLRYYFPHLYCFHFPCCAKWSTGHLATDKESVWATLPVLCIFETIYLAFRQTVSIWLIFYFSQNFACSFSSLSDSQSQMCYFSSVTETAFFNWQKAGFASIARGFLRVFHPY